MDVVVGGPDALPGRSAAVAFTGFGETLDVCGEPEITAFGRLSLAGPAVGLENRLSAFGPKGDHEVSTS